MNEHFRPTRAEIDLDAIRSNVRALGAAASGAELLAVVKANAYGHGDIEVARTALDAGASWLGVVLVEEGIRLRDGGIEAPILVLVDPPRAAAKAVVEHRLTAGVSSRETLDAIDEAAQAASTVADVHICVDTGMHREGVPLDDLVDVVRYTIGLDGVRVEGLWSHLANADAQDDAFNATQIARFDDACARVREAGFDVRLRHLGNSAGIFADGAQHNLVRMGIAMYGLYPAPWLRERVTLRPAMRLASAVTGTRRVAAGEGVSYGLTYAPERDATICNIPIGYGDGYPRGLSNKADVLIGGKRRRIAGRVTMDTIMVDCGSDEIEVGADVVLLGRQGDEEITADELADIIGTINYEIVTAIGPRVPRVYIA